MPKLTKETNVVLIAVPIMGFLMASSAVAAPDTCNWKTARDLANAGDYAALCDCAQVTPSFLERLQGRSDFETTLQVTGAQCPGLAILLTDLPTASINESRRGQGPESDIAQLGGQGTPGSENPGDGNSGPGDGNTGPGNGGENDGPGDGGGSDNPGDGGNDGPGEGGGSGPGKGGGNDGPGKGGGKGNNGGGKGGGNDGPGKGSSKGNNGGGNGSEGSSPGRGKNANNDES